MGSPLHASPPPGGKLRLSIFLEEAQGKFSRHTGANEHQEGDGKLQNQRCSLVVVVQYVSNEANVDDTFGSIVSSNYGLQLSLLSTDAHITLGINESHCLSVLFADYKAVTPEHCAPVPHQQLKQSFIWFANHLKVIQVMSWSLDFVVQEQSSSSQGQDPIEALVIMLMFTWGPLVVSSQYLLIVRSFYFPTAKCQMTRGYTYGIICGWDVASCNNSTCFEIKVTDVRNCCWWVVPF